MFLPLDSETTRLRPQAEIGPAEQAAWEEALATTLTPAMASARPSSAFVAQLGQRLAETAKRDALEQQRREERLRTARLVGGVFSVVGGLVVWLLWRQHHKTESLAPSKPAFSWGFKPLTRAHHPAHS